MAWSTLITLACAVAYVQAHGRLMDPLNRASLWRFGYNSPPNYDDDGMNCGGFYHQWYVNDGKCGICGDAYDQAQPRAHELGGIYGAGYIVANYEAGQVISTNVYLSASHLGFWELRICPDPYHQEQECFDNGYLLELEEGGTKFYPTRGDGTYEVKFRLPADLTCAHCVLQWQYTAGNSWGRCTNGTEGLGCGNQEQFYSCADISIGESSSSEDIKDVTDRVTNRVTDATTTAPDTTVVTERTEDPQRLSTPFFDKLTHNFIYLNPIELQLLLRRLEMAGICIHCDKTTTNRNLPPKKYKNKHRRKKNNKRKTKRHKKMIFWR